MKSFFQAVRRVSHPLNLMMMAGFLQNPMLAHTAGAQGAEGLERHKSAAELFAAAVEGLHNWGADRMVANQLKELGPRILNDLGYAGEGGVLVIARFQVVQTDAGSFRSLIARRVDYVGIGRTPAEAFLADLGNPSDPFYVVESGKRIDVEGSTAYWFSKDSNGQVRAMHTPYTWLRRETLALYSQRTLSNYDWALKREEELTRLIRAYSTALENAEVRSQIESLATSRKNSLAALKEINARLERAKQAALKASANATLVTMLGMAASFVTLVSAAADGLAPSDAANIRKETTREGVLAELDAISKRAEAEFRELQQRALRESNNGAIIEFDIKARLRENNVPVDNLPPSQPPVIHQSPSE
jgi:hypothetical protein